MVTDDSLWLLARHYHLDSHPDCFNEAIWLASKELENVLDETREYPPFFYYLILEHMDGQCYTPWRTLSRAEKESWFNKTLEALKSFI